MKHFALFLLIVICSCSTAQSTANMSIDEANAAEIVNYRKEKLEEFIKSPRTPLDTEAKRALLSYYNFDPAYICKCKFEAEQKKEVTVFKTSSKQDADYIKYGKATCQLRDTTIVLSLYLSVRLMSNPAYKDYLFIPFKDHTNGESTYGGGRYMEARLKDIVDNKITLNFNKAYNPWCAYADGFSCPIPPKENHLNLSIFAGEKNYIH
jgi:uncharacterized protein